MSWLFPFTYSSAKYSLWTALMVVLVWMVNLVLWAMTAWVIARAIHAGWTA